MHFGHTHPPFYSPPPKSMVHPPNFTSSLKITHGVQFRLMAIHWSVVNPPKVTPLKETTYEVRKNKVLKLKIN